MSGLVSVAMGLGMSVVAIILLTFRWDAEDRICF